MSEQSEERTVADAVDHNEDQLKEIKDNTGQKYDYSKITINRVPDKAIEKLKDLAYDKFAGDYGLALAYLLEINDLKTEFDSKMSVTNEKVLELQNEVMQLKDALQEKQENESDNSKVDTIG